ESSFVAEGRNTPARVAEASESKDKQRRLPSEDKVVFLPPSSFQAIASPSPQCGREALAFERGLARRFVPSRQGLIVPQSTGPASERSPSTRPCFARLH